MSQLNKGIALAIFLILAVTAFLIIKPFFTGIFLALLLAFLIRPVYRKINSKFNYPAANALIVTALTLLAVLGFILVSLQISVTQIMDFYTYTKTTDLMAPIKALTVKLLSTEPTQFAFLFDTAVEKGTAAVINAFNNLVFQIPLILMQSIVAFFTLFYFLKDGDEIISYCKSILPFKDDIKNRFIERFKEITSGVIYGYILVGIFQGLTAGIGFFIFGVKGAFVLTLLAIVLSILPLGPWIIWMPVAANMIYNGRTGAGVGMLIYGLIVVSYVDNILKPYLIGSKIKLSPVITIIGMLGGAMLFGFIGAFAGPIILAYLLLFIDFYRSSMKEVI